MSYFKSFKLNSSLSSLMSPQMLEDCALSMRLAVAPNLHWGRGDCSPLSFWLIIPVLLSSGCLFQSTYSAMNCRSPSISVFILHLFRNLFPLDKSGYKYILNEELSLLEIGAQTRATILMLQSTDCKQFTTGIFFGSAGVHYKRNLIGHLDRIAHLCELNDLSSLTSYLVDILMLCDSIAMFKKVAFANAVPYFHFGNTETAQIGLRSYYVYNDEIVCSYNDDEVVRTFYSLAKILQISQSVVISGFRSPINQLPALSGSLFMGCDDNITLLNDVVHAGLHSAVPFATETEAPPSVKVEKAVGKVGGGNQKGRGFSTDTKAPKGGIKVYTFTGKVPKAIGTLVDGVVVLDKSQGKS
jgi:hypothetical protein